MRIGDYDLTVAEDCRSLVLIGVTLDGGKPKEIIKIKPAGTARAETDLDVGALVVIKIPGHTAYISRGTGSFYFPPEYKVLRLLRRLEGPYQGPRDWAAEEIIAFETPRRSKPR